MSVFIIAEAGVNHNGNINLAKKLVDIAVECKVDAVKFQTWKTDLLVTKNAIQAKYQIKNTNNQQSQYNMLKKLELTYENFIELKNYCDQKNILFLSTADEIESANFLYNLQDIFKIGSGELTNIPFLEAIGQFKKKIILSTGMGTLSEIDYALNTIISAGTPKKNITLLHATTEYPAPLEEVNLKAIKTMHDTFKIDVGYSDHTMGIEIAIAATSLGATIIEKHFTIDKNMEGPDHKASIEPHELKVMVNTIRNIEKALGNGIKTPTYAEQRNIPIVRKSIIAQKFIKKGDIFNSKNITTKRPLNGICASEWNNVIGLHANRDYNQDEHIDKIVLKDKK